MAASQKLFVSVCLKFPRSLDLSGSNPGLASPIPFAATAASGLQALRIRLDAPPDEWWPDVQWKLRCFPALKVSTLCSVS